LRCAGSAQKQNIQHWDTHSHKPTVCVVCVRDALTKLVSKEDGEHPECTYLDLFDDEIVSDLIDWGSCTALFKQLPNAT
jgi:hypothetical protein